MSKSLFYFRVILVFMAAYIFAEMANMKGPGFYFIDFFPLIYAFTMVLALYRKKFSDLHHLLATALIGLLITLSIIFGLSLKFLVALLIIPVLFYKNSFMRTATIAKNCVKDIKED